MPVRLFIADDNVLMRDALRAVLDSEPGLTVVGEAGDGRTAVEQAVALRADVVLMDLHMPAMNGTEATRLLRSLAPAIQVLVLTTQVSVEEARSVVLAGAAGLLLKDAPADVLVSSVLAVHAGVGAAADDSPRVLLGVEVGPPAASFGAAFQGPRSGGPDGQTDQGLAVLRLLANGSSAEEAARSLSISQSTLRLCLGRLCAAWGVSDAEEAMKTARAAGLL